MLTQDNSPRPRPSSAAVAIDSLANFLTDSGAVQRMLEHSRDGKLYAFAEAPLPLPNDRNRDTVLVSDWNRGNRQSFENSQLTFTLIGPTLSSAVEGVTPNYRVAVIDPADGSIKNWLQPSVLGTREVSTRIECSVSDAALIAIQMKLLRENSAL